MQVIRKRDEEPARDLIRSDKTPTSGGGAVTDLRRDASNDADEEEGRLLATSGQEVAAVLPGAIGLAEHDFENPPLCGILSHADNGVT